MKIKHTLRDGRTVLITGYEYLGEVMAWTEIDGKYHEGELLPPHEQSDNQRKTLDDKGCAGYWVFGVVAIPPDKGQQLWDGVLEEEKQKVDAERMELEEAIKAGTAFRVADITEQYGSYLSWAREDTFPNYIVQFAGSDEIQVEAEAIRTVVGDRQSCGSFHGCYNRAWRVTADEWDKIIVLSHTIQVRAQRAREEREAAEIADIEHKKKLGFCFHCNSWCYGDCGHYTNNPYIQYESDFKGAIGEGSYGVVGD